MSGPRRLELTFWIIGTAACSFYALAHADAMLSSRAALESFSKSDWSESRVRAYEQSLAQPAGAAIATLRVHSVNLEVPIYADTSALHLNRGAGIIEGTAMPGSTGNIGIAGHRDGFFRALKDVQPGDVIDLRTRQHVYRFRISQITVVDRTDARLLRRTQQPVVTLVTCYPIYFVGPAPRRLVVRGVLESTEGSAT